MTRDPRPLGGTHEQATGEEGASVSGSRSIPPSDGAAGASYLGQVPLETPVRPGGGMALGSVGSEPAGRLPVVAPSRRVLLSNPRAPFTIQFDTAEEFHAWADGLAETSRGGR